MEAGCNGSKTHSRMDGLILGCVSENRMPVSPQLYDHSRTDLGTSWDLEREDAPADVMPRISTLLARDTRPKRGDVEIRR